MSKLPPKLLAEIKNSNKTFGLNNSESKPESKTESPATQDSPSRSLFGLSHDNRSAGIEVHPNPAGALSVTFPPSANYSRTGDFPTFPVHNVTSVNKDERAVLRSPTEDSEFANMSAFNPIVNELGFSRTGEFELELLEAVEINDGKYELKLLEAVENNNEKAVLNLIHKKRMNNLNPLDFNHATVLNKAILIGNKDIVRILINAGVNLEALDRLQRTPLHFAVHHSGNVEIINELIEAGANLEAMSSLGTPIYLAILRSTTEVVAALIAAGANIDTIHGSGETPFSLSHFRKDKKLSEILINAKAKKISRPYSSELNPTELTWAHLKSMV